MPTPINAPTGPAIKNPPTTIAADTVKTTASNNNTAKSINLNLYPLGSVYLNGLPKAYPYRL